MAISDLLGRWLQVGEHKIAPPDHPFYQQFIRPLVRTMKQERFSYYYRPFKWSGDPIYEQLKKEDPATKKSMVFWLVKDIRFLNKQRRKNKSLASNHPISLRQAVEEELLKLLLKASLPFSLAEIVDLFTQFKKKENHYGVRMEEWPMGWACKQLERAVKREAMSDEHIEFFTSFISQPAFLNPRSSYYYGSDLKKVKANIEKVLHEAAGYEATVPPVYLSEEDPFGKFINEKIAGLPLEKKNAFYRLLDLVRDVNGGKPGRKFEKQSQAIIDEIGKRAYRKWLKESLQFLVDLKESSQEHSYPHGIRIYTYTTTTYLYDSNNAVAKGLVWTMLPVQDKAGLQLIQQLAVRAFKKIPQVGAAATAVGNACFYVLAHAKGLGGLALLSRLRVQVKQNSAKKLIDKYLDQQSEARGTSRQELEEMAITDYGLVDGEQVFEFKDYQLKLSITGVGKTKLSWIKPDGNLQKSVPAFVKQQARWKKKLQQVKATNKGIQQAISLERDKLDRSYLENRSWTFARFQQLFIEHGLLSYLGKRLVWTFEQAESTVNAIWREGQWWDAAG
ncbi:MAG: DUF4132 domain-containing protein, partial [Cyanothece sp. SIO1E1]|nr:DUF4132 domain-containing protein [Cyanothece sp. SIO1E1]